VARNFRINNYKTPSGGEKKNSYRLAAEASNISNNKNRIALHYRQQAT
jgi:hypothetical protein